MRERWVSGQQIIDEYHIMPFDLLGYMRQGLQAYTQAGRKVLDVSTAERRRKTWDEAWKETVLATDKDQVCLVAHLKRNDVSPPYESGLDVIAREAVRKFEEEHFVILNPAPDAYYLNFAARSDDEAAAVLSEIADFRFKMEDVVRHINAPSPSVSAGTDDYFIRKGDVWNIRYDGKETSIKDAKGIYYITCLLERPMQQIDIMEFVRSDGFPDSPAIPARSHRQHGVNPDKILKKVKELYTDLAKADTPMEQEEIQKEIKREMSKYTKASKQSEARDPGLEKERKRVQKAIKTAIEAVKKVLPELSEHLKEYIQTGYDCVYRHDRQWYIQSQRDG